MNFKDLHPQETQAAGHKPGTTPKIRAARLLGFVVLLACALFTVGCEDEYPGLTAEELQSDSMPEFDDAAFAGTWISEGEYVSFEVKEHGVYLLKPAGKQNDGAPEDPIPFRLKRAGDALIMEYTVEMDGENVYRPCVVAVDQEALELRCLVAETLAKIGVEFESRKSGEEETKIIRAPQERLKQIYSDQMNNPKIFQTQMRMTRPQPARIARWKRKAVRGDAEAQELLARAFEKGEIVARNYDEAIEWAQRAAESRRPSGEVLYGDLLVTQSQSSRNMLESENLQHVALSWYQRAAEQKYPRAFSRLGHIYEGPTFKDDSSAIDSYKRGAEFGDADSLAQLGFRSYSGNGIPKDERSALIYLELVPESDRDQTTWDTLARIYLFALEPEQRDPKKALHAAESAFANLETCDSSELLARAAFENGQYLRAVEYQNKAICEPREGVEDRRAVLAYYQSFVPEGTQVAAEASKGQ